MKYRQLDTIKSIQPGKSLTGTRTLRADEEHLLDHFPRFPVMPGVMMLEALHQAAIWLVRSGDNFQTPLVLLREVRSVKFGEFLAPGETLDITAETIKTDGDFTTIKASAKKGDKVTVSARLIIEKCKTGDCDRIGTDEEVRRCTEEQFQELFGDDAVNLVKDSMQTT
ncbi:3-hydroxyacyl-[acyl-carrier-protein] dehydratase FabZ [Rubripirellula obstinata]|uniref:3-hydroxyacyl-[acyl-carrier-protein] dehydratase FabZ n=1 Tax=Rubripirellula obstinata TaxID=406547 RepID=A0A5B1CMP5_9BACT|nr:3-hydroxyacyl-ACP dehydratase FabZ family protein [Rubripirellula obstinata]KAA1260633.1 3-hydroxyacyl-[acyl-carrier-protein] dehydratase FabZ [Rubripirellula obstinata]